MDHIRGHLDEDLSLPEVAKVASFSPYHFHRIFKGMTGETVASFTRRARLERAVYLMRGSPCRELSSIAVEVGFSTPSEFSRVFRSHYGQAPSQWDRRSRLDDETDFVGDLGEVTDCDARIVSRDPCRVMYVRVRDPWRGAHLQDGYARLTARLEERSVAWRSGELLGMSWDSEKATPLDKLVYDLGITVPEEIAADDEFGVHELPCAKAVEVHCESLRDTAVAWDYLYRRWLPESRFEPTDMPAIKRFRRVPEVFGAGAWDVDCSIALRDRMP